MIHRQLIDDLTEWSKRENHKPLYCVVPVK